MITTDQIKAAIDRVEALNKYLNIEEKKIQLEEEELKTQAPEFWQDQKRAEAQMKLVKGLNSGLKATTQSTLLSTKCKSLTTSIKKKP